jgi:hypothetical protein
MNGLNVVVVGVGGPVYTSKFSSGFFDSSFSAK